LTARHELAQYQSLVRASLERLRMEKWRPWVPALQLVYNIGGFGGGPGSAFSPFGERVDFDAILAWELRGLGYGNRALVRERASQLAQANLTAEQTRDAVLAEIARAYHQVRSLRERPPAANSPPRRRRCR
jgi:outer membrane protein TolC